MNGLTRSQIDNGLEVVRQSGRAWPPTAPEFRSICLLAGREKVPPMELLFTEMSELIRSGKNSYLGVSRYLYHLISKNLDFYVYKNSTVYENLKMFEVAYKAMCFQLESGHELASPPAPNTLLESKPEIVNTPENVKKASAVINDLLSMFDTPEKEAKPLSKAEIDDLQRLEKIREKI